MDLREIQALHAQYTAQPVIIDVASHTAAMPALPAPDRGGAAGARIDKFVGKLSKAGKPTLVALAIAAVAAVGGMSIARIWHAMHETVAAQKVLAASSAATHAPVPASEPTLDRPIDANPAHPLTSKDLDSVAPVSHSALSNIDARSLASTTSAPSVDRTAPTARAAAENVAAASPIRIQRPATPIVPATVASAAPAPQAVPTADAQVRSLPAPAPVPQQSPVQSKAPVAAPVQEAAKPETRPALRPLHHVTRRQPTTPSNEASPEPAAPTQPKAQPGKTGDVQLF